MKQYTILSVAAALAVSLTTTVRADDTPLGKEMSGANKALRTLKRQAADPAQKAANLELLGKVKAGMEKALTMEPSTKKYTGASAEEKKKIMEAYKADLGDVIKACDELKAALEKGDAAATEAALKSFADLKERGHKNSGADEE